MRKVKSIEDKSGIVCENCIFFNENDCNLELPVMFTPSDSFCSSGQWKTGDLTFGLVGILQQLKLYVVIDKIKDISCQNCVFYKSENNECHYSRDAIYNSLPDSWCSNGLWFHFRECFDTDIDDMDYSSGYFIYNTILSRDCQPDPEPEVEESVTDDEVSVGDNTEEKSNE